MGKHLSIIHLGNFRQQFQGGFTLIEMIVSLALLGLLASIFGMGLVGAVESYDFSRSNVQVAQRGQMVMARMGRELTDLTRIVNVNLGTDPYIVYESIQEVNGRPTTSRWGLHFNSADQRVRLYENPPDQLNGSTIGQGDILIDGVQQWTLRYFQGGNELLTWPFTAAPSVMQVTLNMLRPENSTQTQNFTTLVYLRNTENDGGALR
jgi:prepilin-type N-terminal cleavage/methylation domain-containing protein